MSISNTVKLSGIAISLSLLWGCGGDSAEPGKELLSCPAPMIPDAAGTSCIAPPPIQCAAPTVPDEKNEQCVVGADPTLPAPTVVPGPNQTVLYYNNPGVAENTPNDATYEGYRLHSWNDGTCDAYAEPFDTTDWANGHIHDGVDPNYGAYWIINLKEGYGECGNFIIHIGTEGSGKALGDVDLKMPLMQDDETFVRMNFTLHGEPSVFEYPILNLGERPATINGMSAHWIDSETLLWNQASDNDAVVKLHHSPQATLTIDETGVSGSSYELSEVELSDAQRALVPHLADWAAYSLDVNKVEAKQLVKSQLVMASYSSEDKPLAATYVQAAKVLDDLYTKGEDDANEAVLGTTYNGDEVTVAAWAPTAQNLKLQVYDADKNLTNSHDMSFNETSGVWSFTGSNLDRKFYRFEVTVYHPATKQIETVESTDPYSLNVSMNGRFSQFVNLNDADLKPEGWDEQTVATISDPEDAIIYEGHVRDFSARDESTAAENRGKYLAFTEESSAPVNHLKALVENGLTHFHVLPVTDIASINEDVSERIDINDTLGELCDIIDNNANACKTESHTSTIIDLLEGSLSGSGDAQALVEAMRSMDSFNWGYDPHHFIAPEGSYASESEGVARVIELRAMNKSLHDMGLRVVLDVVYNHTSSSGVFDNSVFDKLVPGYFHRYNEETGNVERSTCCENTATEHVMMDKFVSDSLVILAKEYGYDGFRFDVMGHMPKSSILAAREAVQAVDADNYFYGEGWNFGEVADNRLFTQATQANMAGTEVGTFNDRIRESVRSGAIFKTVADDGTLREQDTLRLSLAGNLQNYVLKDFNGRSAAGNSFTWNSQPTAYALDPADSINYVSKHDNETLWDQLQYSNDVGLDIESRVRIQNIAATIPLLSQGIPFFQMGGDLLRSKSMDRNSYDSGDWFNLVDFTKETNNWNVGLPRQQDNGQKWDEISGISANPNAEASMSDIEFASNIFHEFLKIRSQSKLLRLNSESDIISRLGFHNVGRNQTQGLIVMSLDDGSGLADLDPAIDAMVVVVNASNEEQSHTIPTATGFSLHPVLVESSDPQVRSASFADASTDDEIAGRFTVPAYTTAVFVKAQGDTQGVGLSAIATVGAPDVVPYGSTSVYLRGSMNGWSTDDELTYIGAGSYQVAVSLTAGTEYEFKLADADWAVVNLGGVSDVEAIVERELNESLSVGGANLKFTPAHDTVYHFTLNAANTESPVLTVTFEEPYFGTAVYLRGGMNGWGTDDQLEYLGEGLYRIDVQVAAGVTEFKLGDADWASVNLGSAGGDIELADELLLAANGGNISLDFPEETAYSFILNATDKSLPVLTVLKTEMFAGNSVFIRGSLNGWGTDDELVYQNDGTYSFTKSIDAGDYEFKIATEDWSTVDFGAFTGEESVELDEVSAMASKGANIQLSIAESGNYQFTVIGPDINNLKILVTRVN
ncbi:pullulanase-type alpha-1,6-glucosidase [Parashewanella spongiae]